MSSSSLVVFIFNFVYFERNTPDQLNLHNSFLHSVIKASWLLKINVFRIDKDTFLADGDTILKYGFLMLLFC